MMRSISELKCNSGAKIEVLFVSNRQPGFFAIGRVCDGIRCFLRALQPNQILSFMEYPYFLRKVLALFETSTTFGGREVE
jgi:hypothetical protein